MSNCVSLYSALHTLMSEEIIKLPLAPQSNEPDDVSLRSNSPGKSASSKTTKSVVPHYLRASTGSCHDLCKYGRRQAFEEKPWRPMRRRIAAKPPPHIDVQSLAEREVLLSSRKKSPGVEHKPSSQTSSHVSDFHEIIKHEVLPQSHGSRRNSLGTEFVDDLKSVDSEALSGMKKSARVSLNPSSDNQTQMSGSVDIIKQELSTKPPGSQTIIEDEVHDIVNTEVLLGENNLGTNHKPSCNSRPRRPASADIIKREESKNPRSSRNTKEPKLLSGRKQTTVARQKSSDSKACFSNDSEITKHMVSSKEASLKSSARGASLKIKPVAVEASASPDTSGISNSKSNIELKMANNARASKVAVKKVQIPPASSSKVAAGKVLASPRVSTSKVKASPTIFVPPRPVVTRVSSSMLRKQRSQKIGSLKNHKSKNAELNQPDDEVVDKTLYIIKVDSARNSLETENNEGHAELHPYPSLTPNHKSLTSNDGVNKKEPKRTPRKAATDGTEGKSIKLNFQRGKLIDIQSETRNPRRLKYRRARIVGEKPNVKVNSHRRSFKERGEVDGYNDSSQARSEKVVLRHQDMVAKKDAQGLLNYVIEETASKLVETRKSKVKALVGAFESVISTKKPNL